MLRNLPHNKFFFSLLRLRMNIFQRGMVGTQGSHPGLPGRNEEKRMRRKYFKKYRKRSAGKLVTGVLLGGAVAAAVAWLTSPAAGEGSRHRLRDKIKTSEGNVESRAQELAADVENQRNPF